MSCVYLFMIGRVFFTFDQSEYQISRPVLIFYASLILLNVSAWTLYILIIAANTDFTEAAYLLRGFEIALMIDDFVLNLSFLALFVHKLYQLLVVSAVERNASISMDRMAPAE